MTSPKKGDRVRVTFEAVYSAKGVLEGHYFEAPEGLVVRPFAPDGATLEVIETPFVLPTEVGSVVRVSYVDGSGHVAMLRSDGKWVDESGWVFSNPSNLVDGAKVEVASFSTPEAAKPAEKLIDGDGDAWYLRDNGMYTMFESDAEDTGRTREYIENTYGIRKKD